LIVSTLLIATAAYTASAQTIVDYATSNAQLSTLVSLLTQAGLVTTLSGAGPYTVFAPLNPAFSKAPVSGLVLSGTNLTTTLTYHVVSGNYTAANVLAAGANGYPTVAGPKITFSNPPSGPYVNFYAKITQTDIICSNGIVHLIDTVIEANVVSLLTVAQTTPSLSTLLTLAAQQGLGPTLSNVTTKNALTVIAPANTAFTTLSTSKPLFYNWLINTKNTASLTSVLTYHVIPSGVFAYQLTDGANVATVNGQTLLVNLTGGAKFQDAKGNAAKVTLADVAAYNGVAHVVDTVLIPTTPYDSLTDIVATAQGNADLSSLVSSVLTAGLATALSNPNGPFTVFAPKNSAFAKFPVGAITDVTDLANTLKYHVIQGRIYASQLAATQTVTTLFGDTITITKDANGVKINGYATVTTADVDCTNGVVHVIDTVIETSNMTIAKAATSTGSTGSNALSSLLSFVGTAGLTSSFTTASSTLTLLAPNNAAFVAFHKTNIGSWYTNAKWVPTQLAGLLLNHVVGSTVFSSALTNGQVVPTLAGAGSLTVSITGSTVKFSAQNSSSGTVTVADIPSYKGVVHIIDGVLIPNPPTGYPTKDIAGNAVATADLSTLVTQLTTAGLVSAVSEPNGPYTVLAPVNGAFSAISSTLAGLSADQVSTVLQYHVIKNDINANGRLYSTDLVNGSTYTTYNGLQLTCLIDTSTTPATVSFLSSSGIVAKVLTADVDSTNGVVHIIDTVLIPTGILPSPTPKPNGAAAASASFFALILALIAATMSTF
jgi:transforming growth factor-beta-induced protein